MPADGPTGLCRSLAAGSAVTRGAEVRPNIASHPADGVIHSEVEMAETGWCGVLGGGTGHCPWNGSDRGD